MGISISGIDIASQGLNNELRIAILERIIELVLQRSNVTLTAEEIANIRQEALVALQNKYPTAGIQLRNNEGGQNG